MGDFLPAMFDRKDVLVAEAGDDPVGWASVMISVEVAWLDDLWVSPPWIRQGIGRQLFEASAQRAHTSGATRMEWEAEPNALGFYERMGGRIVRHVGPDPIWRRTLPVMAVALP